MDRSVGNTPISPLHSISRHEQEQIVKRKASVSSLLGRLTQPTLSSRQKSKQPPLRSISAQQQTSPKAVNSKRSVSHNDVYISKPIPLPKPQTPMTRPIAKEINTASRRKAPDPPQLRDPQRPKPLNLDQQQPQNGPQSAPANSDQMMTAKKIGVNGIRMVASQSKIMQQPMKLKEVEVNHHRRLSAPAPPNNITGFRQMSHLKKQSQEFHMPSRQPTDLNGSPESVEEEQTPLSTPSPSTEKPVLMDFTSEDELLQLKTQNRKLKVSNKMMKSKLDELSASQEQVNAELAICQAAKNSLEQQVKGYEAVQQATDKKLDVYKRELAKSKGKVAQLKTMVQELKISLEEREIETFRSGKR